MPADNPPPQVSDQENTKKETSHVESLKYYLSRQNSAQSYSAEMSKWILASLVFVNAGPYIIASKDNAQYVSNLLNTSHYFAAGLASAILCGFFAWMNTGFREMQFGYNAEKEMRALSGAGEDGSSELEPRALNYVIYGAYILSIFMGFSSLILFFCGVIALMRIHVP